MRAVSRTMFGGGMAAIAVAIALTGCTAADADPAASETPDATPSAAPSSLAADPLTGTGPVDPSAAREFPIPEGARSVTIDLVCEGGGSFTAGVGNGISTDHSLLMGTCDGSTSLVFPVDGQTSPIFTLWLLDGVDWVATPVFSTAEFERDETITAECAAFADVYSALMNADQGYGTYQAFGLDEWNTRVDAAAADLDALAASSKTTMASGFGDLLDVVRSPDRVPGLLSMSAQPDTVTGGACSTNHSPLVINAEFGG